MDPRTQDAAKARMNHRLRDSSAYEIIIALTAKRPKAESGVNGFLCCLKSEVVGLKV